jgi:hypothetical protein
MTANPTKEPKRLTFNLVNEALKTRPGYAGEELVQGNGYLYFQEGNASAWRGGSSIPVCRLGHTTLQSILADFDQFVKDNAEYTNLDGSQTVGSTSKFKIVGEEPAAAPAMTESPAEALMALAKASMLDRLKESRWYRTAPESARATEPEITIVGIEQREVAMSMGILPMGRENRPHLVGRVELAGITAELSMRLDFFTPGGFALNELSSLEAGA